MLTNIKNDVYLCYTTRNEVITVSVKEKEREIREIVPKLKKLPTQDMKNVMSMVDYLLRFRTEQAQAAEHRAS